MKRAKSPFMSDPDSESDDEGPSPVASALAAHSRTTSHDSESYKRTRAFSRGNMTVDDSERDLAMRLELARRNSQNQNGHEYQSPIEEPLEETIYEGV